MNARLLTILLLAATAFRNAFGASAPSEVAEIRWGVSPASVRGTLARRPGVDLVEETPNRLTFKGGMFAGHSVESWRFEFRDGKFAKASIAFVRPDGKDDKGGWLVDQVWGDLQKLLNEKYGKAQKLSDSNHGEFLWTFRDSSRPGATKTIDLYYGFGTRLDVTYSDNLPTIGPTPIPKSQAKRDI